MKDLYVSVRGKQVRVPAVEVGGVQVIVTGRWLKIAAIHDEDYIENEAIPDPNELIRAVKGTVLKPDLLSFSQPFTEPAPKYDYPAIIDNAAAIPLTTHEAWWESLPQETRRNVRLASKRGITTQVEQYGRKFAEGIASIYNESAVRQGRRFWHYGKNVDIVERENGTYVQRSSFIAAWFGTQLAGFIKMVYTGRVAGIMQILARQDCQEKKVTNALLAKAVEVACQRNCSHLVYCKYTYHKNVEEPLREFKRRNAFLRYDYPRYFVPLTLFGKLAVAGQMHRPKTDLIPGNVVAILLKARFKLHQIATQSK